MDNVPYNINELISIVMTSNYTIAFNMMQSYFCTIIDKDKYKTELEQLAVWLYRKYSTYNDNTPIIIDGIKAPELVTLIRIAQTHYISMHEGSDELDYKKILTSDEYEFLISLYRDSYIGNFNIIVAGIKYNALYHRIKDYFIPIIYK